MERLAAHPDICAYEELLLQDREGWPTWPPGAGDRPFVTTYLHERGIQPSRRALHSNLFGYLDYVFASRRGVRAVGFKLMYDEAFPFPELLLYCRWRGVRVVHLIRRNVLDVAVSRMAMSQRKFVHAWNASEREELRVQVDTGRLLRSLEYLDWQRRLMRVILKTARVATHEVAYEALLVDDRPLYDILAFLQVPVRSDMALSGQMLKLAPLSHRSGIANYDDVDVCLMGTRFHRLLRP